MATKTTMIGRMQTLGRLVAALGVAAGLLLGQLALTDAPSTSAAKSMEEEVKELEEMQLPH